MGVFYFSGNLFTRFWESLVSEISIVTGLNLFFFEVDSSIKNSIPVSFYNSISIGSGLVTKAKPFDLPLFSLNGIFTENVPRK